MANSHGSTLSTIHTPFSPAEALALSPLRSCGIASPRPASKRSTSSRWRYEDRNWWVEDGKATVFARSVSASAVPAAAEPRKTYHAGCIAHDRLANSRNRISDDHFYERMPGGYTPEQIAGYNLYSVKAKRLSSHEYGINHAGAPPPVSPVSSHPTSSPADPGTPSRIVELEGSPPTSSPSQFQNPPISSTLYANSPAQFASHATSPTKSGTAMTILRKPVGSGVSPKASRASDPLLIWTIESPKDTGHAQTREIRQQQQYAKSYDSDETPYGRQQQRTHHAGYPRPSWETDSGHPYHETSSISGAYRDLHSANGSPTGKGKRPKPPVRFQSGLAPEAALRGKNGFEEEALNQRVGALRKRNAHTPTQPHLAKHHVKKASVLTP
jgi:hypothetical protein